MNKIVVMVILLVVLYLLYHQNRQAINSQLYAFDYITLKKRPVLMNRIENKAPRTKEWYSQKIPRKIHQTGFSRNTTYDLYKASLVNQNANPEYEYFFYDDADCKAFMEKNFPQYIKHYDSLIPGAYKADLFRLLVLYQEGGVYIDNKSSCILPLREIIQADDEVHLIRDVIPECVYNGFMSSVPGHPLIKQFIDRYIKNIEEKYYGINVLDIGGPQMIGRVVNTLLGKPELSPIDSFQKDGVRLSGRIIHSSSGEDIISSDDGTVAYLERSNKSYQKRKVKDIVTLKCYGTRWIMGKVYK